jgi:tellurite resistance protein TehA-like permease
MRMFIIIVSIFLVFLTVHLLINQFKLGLFVAMLTFTFFVKLTEHSKEIREFLKRFDED